MSDNPKPTHRAQLIPKHPNPRLHDARDPRAYVGDPAPDDPTESDWELFYELFSGRSVQTSPATGQAPNPKTKPQNSKP
jgi:hypothetical protein